MPNICLTYVTVGGPQGQIADLYENLRAARDRTDYEARWLGNLWLHLGYAYEDAMSGKLGRCKGELDHIALDPGWTVSMLVSSAWEPNMKPIVEFVSKYAPGAWIRYIAQEPLSGLYLTNDPQSDLVHIEILDDLDDGSMFLEDWPEAMSRKDFLAAAAPLVGPDGGFDAVAARFAEKYGAEIAPYAYAELAEVSP